MGELIRREAARSPLGFSGERMTADISGKIEIEHYHRYLLAREFCRGKDVVDCASGEGYGTALLSQVAKSAVGVEIDPAVVAAAREEFGRPNLQYVQGDARAIPLADDSVDVAVSFETLEHLAEQDVFLSELRRVLRPDGLLIISTPDRDSYSPANMPPNEYHVLELTRAEFETLLGRHFGKTAFAAQRALVGSAILGEAQNVPSRSYERRSDSIIEGSDNLSRAPYVIALASDIDLPPLPNSVYVFADHDLDFQTHTLVERANTLVEQSNALVETERRFTEELQLRLETALAQVGESEHSKSQEAAKALDLEAALSALRQDLVEAKRERRSLLERVLQSDRRTNEAQQHSSQVEAQLAAVQGSTLWRATRPMRRIGARAPWVSRNLRRSAKLVWWGVTLQLPTRYRQRRQATAAQLAAPGGHVPRSVSRDPSSSSGRTRSLTAADVSIPGSHEPVVSIIVSTYGQLDITLACLQSIADHPPRNPIEVIVIDDGYCGIEDMSALRQVGGIRFIAQSENLGFLRSCNSAAGVAKGRYVYMLNNDTEVRPGAIDALVDLLDRRPDVGLAGSKLLFPDGSLQEAGGIIWSDATGCNYGRGDDPTRPEYNYTREVDYCSGASIMLARKLFLELKGFDEAFVPAYCEDSDLAFRIRERGLKVVYEPRSVVVHLEGMSHGTDVNQGLKAHQVSNQALLAERWGAVLEQDHYLSGECDIRARDRARGRKLLLVIDHAVPQPDRDAGSRTMRQMIECFVEAGWVVKFWPRDRAYNGYTPDLEALGVEVIDERWSGHLVDWLQQFGSEIDEVLVSRPEVAIEALPALQNLTDATLAFYGHDLHFVRAESQAELTGNPQMAQEAMHSRRSERAVWRQFDLVMYPSEEEAQRVREMSPSTLVRSIVPYAFDEIVGRAAPPEERTLLFVGGYKHYPNVDAAQFLALEVLPELEKVMGPVSLVLAGSHPTDAVRALAKPGVEVTGNLSDLELAALYARSRVAVVPLRAGAGVKLKVVEALCRGVPLVTTPTGAQGLDGVGVVAAVREDVAGLVEAISRLLTDDAAWIAQSATQAAFAEKLYSRAAMRESLLTAMAAGAAVSAAA